MRENLVAQKYLLRIGARKFSCAEIYTFPVTILAVRIERAGAVNIIMIYTPLEG